MRMNRRFYCQCIEHCTLTFNSQCNGIGNAVNAIEATNSFWILAVLAMHNRMLHLTVDK